MSDRMRELQYEDRKKNVWIAYLLWFFLGGVGAHRFYLGRTGSAVGIIILAVFSFILTFIYIGLVGLLALEIWLIIDAILIPGMVAEYNTRLMQLMGL